MSYCCNRQFVYDGEFKTNCIKASTSGKQGEIVSLKRWEKDSAAGKREIEVWKALYPENVILEDTEGGFLYLARKWVEGTALDSFVAEGRPVGGKNALKIGIGVAEKLSVFYGKTGFVHGDISPSNIIADKDFNATLIDFEGADIPRVGDGMRYGRTVSKATREFTAPEVFDGTLNQRSDIYSLGMVMLYVGWGTFDLSMAGGMGDEYVKFLGKCCNVNPDGRFDTMEEMKAAAEGILSGKAKELGITPLSKPEFTEKSKNFMDDFDFLSEDNVTLFPHYISGYRRQIFYIAGCSAFAAEYAHVLSNEFGLKTMLVGAGEGDAQPFKYYVKHDEVPEFMDFEQADFVAEPDYFDIPETTAFFDTKSDLTENKGKTENKLYRDSNQYTGFFNMSEIMKFDDEEMRDFMLWCYSEFDATVINDDIVSDYSKKVQLMRFADAIIVPADTDVDKAEQTAKFYGKFLENNGIPRVKLAFVGWEYSNRRSAEEKILEGIFGAKHYRGIVSYDNERRTCKNRTGDFYTRVMPEQVKKQYVEIGKNYYQ